MTIDDIKALIAADESRTLELKKSTGELKEGMHAAWEFAALANISSREPSGVLNWDGGWLILGVAPKSMKIAGQEFLGLVVNFYNFVGDEVLYLGRRGVRRPSRLATDVGSA